MVHKIFVAATGQHCGKTTSSLLFMRAAQTLYGRVGFMKPVGQEYREVGDLKVDKDALLMAEVFGLHAYLPHMSPVVSDRSFTRRFIDGLIDPAELTSRVLDCFSVLERDFDAIVIEGTGHSGVGSVFGLSNARVAALLGAPVTIVTGGGIGQVLDRVALALPLYAQERATVRAVMANKILADKREQSLSYLSRALAPNNLAVVGGLDYTPTLSSPSLRSISTWLRQPILGDTSTQDRLVNALHMGVASSQRVVDLLEADTLVVTASTRDELLVTLASLYDIPEYRTRIVGIIVTGIAPVSPITQRILDASRIPLVRTEANATRTLSELSTFVTKLHASDQSKLSWLFDCGLQQIPLESIAGLFSE
ncbi:MAG: AAA family ATPase [Deltaproteobacteria bacterium]|nr:AAA family ATPase [Deltaproteobacteria bacterium]